MAVVSLYFRPNSVILLYKIWKQRKDYHETPATVGADGSSPGATPKKNFGTIFTSTDEAIKKTYRDIL